MEKPGMFRQTPGVVRRGITEKAENPNPAPVVPGIERPVWRSFVGNEAFQKVNKPLVADEQRRMAEAARPDPRPRVAAERTPKWKAGIGRLEVQHPDGQVEEFDPESLLDDPEVGDLAAQSLWKRDVSALAKEEEDLRFRLRDPRSKVAGLSESEREEFSLMAPDDPRRGDFQKRADADAARTKEEQRLYDIEAKKRALASGGVAAWRAGREASKGVAERSERIAAKELEIDAAEEAAVAEERALDEQMRRGVSGAKLGGIQARKAEIAAARQGMEAARGAVGIERQGVAAAARSEADAMDGVARKPAAQQIESLAKDAGVFSSMTDALTTARDKRLVRGPDGKWQTPLMSSSNFDSGPMEGITGAVMSLAGRFGAQTTALHEGLEAIQKKNGFTDEEMGAAWDDLGAIYRKFEDGEKARVTSQGQLVPNAEDSDWLDTSKATAIIEGSGASPESKAATLANLPKIQEQIAAAKAKSYEEAVRENIFADAKIPLFSEFAKANPGLLADQVRAFEAKHLNTRGAVEKWRDAKYASFIAGWNKADSTIMGVTALGLDKLTESERLARSEAGFKGEAVGPASLPLKAANLTRGEAARLTKSSALIKDATGADGLVGALIEELPSLAVQSFLTKGMGGVVGAATGSVRFGQTSAALTAYTTAGAQSTGATYASEIAAGTDPVKAREKALKAGANTALITAVFGVGSLGGVERVAVGRAASMTVSDMVAMARQKGVMNVAKSPELRKFAAGVLKSAGGEATEEGLDELLGAFLTADPGENLADAWSNAMEAAAVGGFIGGVIDVAAGAAQDSEWQKQVLESTPEDRAARVNAEISAVNPTAAPAAPEEVAAAEEIVGPFGAGPDAQALEEQIAAADPEEAAELRGKRGRTSAEEVAMGVTIARQLSEMDALAEDEIAAATENLEGALAFGDPVAIQSAEAAVKKATAGAARPHRARGVLKIARGESLETLTAAEVRSLGITREGKPMKEEELAAVGLATPAVEVLADASLIVLDEALSELSIAARDRVKMGEAEARRKAVERQAAQVPAAGADVEKSPSNQGSAQVPTFTVTGRAGTTIEVEAADEAAAQVAGAEALPMGETVAGVAPAGGKSREQKSADDIGSAFDAMSGAITGNFYKGIEESLRSNGEVPSAEAKSNIGQAWKIVRDKYGSAPDTIDRFMRAVQAVGKKHGDTKEGWLKALNESFQDSPVSDPRIRPAVVKKIAKLKKSLGANLTVTDDPAARAVATDAGIVINPSRLVDEATANGLTETEADVWVQGVIDEELIHFAHLQASQALWEESGTDLDLESWRAEYYGAMWREEFGGDAGATVAKLYGASFDALPDDEKAMEGLRMMSQQLSNGFPTETAKLWTNAGPRIIAAIREALKALKAMVADLSPALKAEIAAIEAQLSKYEQNTGTVPDRGEKPAEVREAGGNVPGGGKGSDNQAPGGREADAGAGGEVLPTGAGSRVSFTRGGERRSGVALQVASSGKTLVKLDDGRRVLVEPEEIDSPADATPKGSEPAAGGSPSLAEDLATALETNSSINARVPDVEGREAARKTRREADSQAEYKKLKTALNEAIKSGDKAKIIAEAQRGLARFETIGFPDDWSRWERVRDDASRPEFVEPVTKPLATPKPDLKQLSKDRAKIIAAVAAVPAVANAIRNTPQNAQYTVAEEVRRVLVDMLNADTLSAASYDYFTRNVENEQWVKTVVRDVEKGMAPDAPAATGMIHAEGGKFYADTRAMNGISGIPGLKHDHVGFGDFETTTPRGKVNWFRRDDMTVEGMTGRVHELSGPPEAVASLVESLKTAGVAESAPAAPKVTVAPKPVRSAADQALIDAMSDLVDGLEAAPLAETFTRAIPPAKIGALIDVAQKYIAEGITTPEAFGARLASLAGGKLKPYSQGLWGAFMIVDPTVDGKPDWAAIYGAPAEPPVSDREEAFENVSRAKKMAMSSVIEEAERLALAGQPFTRAQAAEGDPEKALSKKELDESIEAGITAAAHEIAQTTLDEAQAYAKLVKLYENQPALTAKTSTSKIDQAYSTPAPMAYVATRLLRIDEGREVLFEPSSGHSMLMMGAPDSSIVMVNEINPGRRFRTLSAIPRSAKWTVTGEDATSWSPSRQPKKIAANPPFGAVMGEDGNNIRYQTAAGETTAIDHAIMLKALESMADDGRAVFIIGGPAKTARSEAARLDFYGRGKQAAFFKHLHDNYGVVDHFTVDGDLYAKQGAGWNVDIIVIQGKKPSRIALPSAKAPRMIATWDELFETTIPTDEERIARNRISEDEIRALFRGMVDKLAGIGGAGRPGATGGRPSAGGRPDAGDRQADVADTAAVEGDPGQDEGDGVGSGVDGGGDVAPERQPAGTDAGTIPAGEGAGTGRNAGRGGKPARPDADLKSVGKFQSEYRPFSGAKGLDTLLPNNMVAPVSKAFDRIKADLGDLTAFVRDQLGYPKGEDISKYLAGEQIDAVAAAIWNFQRGGALIVGDQTGIGKGRIAAALMKYAVTQGFTPVFMTQKPTLHDAMLVGDLPDVGAAEVIPAVMDTKLQFDSAKDRKLNYGEAYFEEVTKSGKMVGSNAIFVTYDQIQADDAKGLDKKERNRFKADKQPPPHNWRMRALKAIAPNAVFILDESHLASGQSTRGWRVADVIGRSSRVYYSSATSVKRPENMGIYFKTNAGLLTNGDIQGLVGIMDAGGVPAMQVASSMLAEDGQYLRRERSFQGIEFKTFISQDTASRDRELADGLTFALREIVTVQDSMRSAASAINSVIAQAGKRMQVPAANRAKLETVNFSSKLHNIVSQYLLAIKTASAAELAIDEIRAGRKVVVTVQNTMESAIDGLESGGFGMNYKGLVLAYLDQMRFLKSGNKAFGKGEVETFEITGDIPKEFEGVSDRDLEFRIVVHGRNQNTGDEVLEINEKVAAEIMRRAMWGVFVQARASIEAADIGDLPISPIDSMRQTVERAGIRTGEITGRARGIDESGEIYARPKTDIGQQAQVNAKTGFNDEDLDFLVLNQSGSTGISLHASEKAANKSQRVMIVVQPNLDINEFMQTLGRIHRSGQVTLPKFILLQTALPAEKRPAAILGRKMAMLNANTTSNDKSDVSEGNESVDIFNQYGDEVVYRILERDRDLQGQLRPLGSAIAKFFKEDGSLLSLQEAQTAIDEQPDGYIARTITGYLAILPVEEQETFWERASADYQAMIAYLDATGQNALEAKALDMSARTISREVFTEGGDGDSVFMEPSYIETVETKMGRDPISGDEAVEISKAGRSSAQVKLRAYLSTVEEEMKDLVAKKSKRVLKWDDEKERDFIDGLREQRNTIANAVSLIGRFGSIRRDDGGSGIGVIEEVKINAASPLTPSKQVAVIRVNDSRDVLSIPLTKLADAFTPSPFESAQEWEEGKDVGSERAIATGNLLAAMKTLNGSGKVVTYTTDTGEAKMGILLPKSFLARREAQRARVTIDTAEKLVARLDAGFNVTNADEKVRWVKAGSGLTFLIVPASRSAGGEYWRNPILNSLMRDGEFVQVGGDMRGVVRDIPGAFNLLSQMGERFGSAPKGPRLSAAPLSDSRDAKMVRILQKRIDRAYETGNTEGVEEFEARLETLLERMDTDSAAMDAESEQEFDAALPAPESDLVEAWLRWTGRGQINARDMADNRAEYPNFGQFYRSVIGDGAFAIQDGITDKQIEEAARESADFYEARRSYMKGLQAAPLVDSPMPADDRARAALDKNKQYKFGALRGSGPLKVSFRLDLPSANRGTPVVSIHEPGIGTVIAYDTAVHLRDVRFRSRENEALKIRDGKAKSPMAAVEGTMVAVGRGVEVPAGWSPIRYNPKVHSYFFTADGNPVVSAEEAMQIGGRVYAKGMVHEDPAKFLFAAPLSDSETPENIRRLTAQGRATMADAETEAEARKQQAEFADQGKVVGTPRLANISDDEAVRGEMDVIDEMRKFTATRQKKTTWERDGRALADADESAVVENWLANAFSDEGQAIQAKDVVAARIVMERRVKTAGNDLDKHADNAVLMHGYREARANQARVLAAGTDPFKNPEERHRDYLAGVIYELPPRKIAAIEDRSRTPAAAREAIREAVRARLETVEKALKKLGVTLDEITGGQVFLSLSQTAVMKDTLSRLTPAEKTAVKAIQSGGTVADVRRKSGLSDERIQALAAQVRKELADKLRAKVAAGLKLEDLKDEMKGLRAASLSPADIEAELERILTVGFGIPETVPTARLPKKRTAAEPDDENDPNAAAKRVARRWIDRLATSQSDTLAWRDKAKMSELEALIREHLKKPVPDFIAKATALGATAEQARVLNGEAATERQRAEMIRQWRKDNPKPRKVKPTVISTDWNRPEFADELASYAFDTKDRAKIMANVIALRDLVAAGGKIERLSGEKKQKAIAIIAEVNNLLAKDGVTVADILKKASNKDDYRFDITDRVHVMILARTIRALDADIVDKGSEYFYSSILSGLQTMMVNATGAFNTVWQATVDRGVESAINVALKDPQMASFAEVKYMLKAMGPMFSRAWSNAQATWSAETPFFDEDVLGRTPDLVRMQEGTTGYKTGSISGTKGRVIRIPGRILMATDEFMNTARAVAEVGAMAYRFAVAKGLKPGTAEFDKLMKQQVNIPGSEAWQMAGQRALVGTFNNALPGQRNAQGQTTKIRTLIDLAGGAIYGLTHSKWLQVEKSDGITVKLLKTIPKILFFPFVRVPFNILKQGIERSVNPISLFGELAPLLAHNVRIRDGRLTMNADGDKARIMELVGKQVQGAFLMILLVALGEGDDDDLEKMLVITGSRPFGDTKKGERELGYRLGLGPYEISMKTPGGKRVGFSYGRIEPVATVLGGTVDTLRSLKAAARGRTPTGEALGKILSSFVSQGLDKTSLRGAADLQSILAGEKSLDRFTADRIGAIMPNILKQAVRETDPVFREKPDDFMGMVARAVWPRGGPAAMDVYGEAQDKKGTSVSRILDFTDFGSDEAQPYDAMLWRYKQKNPDPKTYYAPQSASTSYTIGGVDKKMNAAQAARFKEAAGKRTLVRLKAQTFNLTNPTEYDIKRFRDAVDKGRDDARKILFNSPAWQNLK